MKAVTANEAIRYAARRVSMTAMSHSDYLVTHWSPAHKAWWEVHCANRFVAYATLKEARVRLALEHYGMDADTAGEVAHHDAHDDPSLDWRSMVRAAIKTWERAKAEA